jgi:hypothetical protein
MIELARRWPSLRVRGGAEAEREALSAAQDARAAAEQRQFDYIQSVRKQGFRKVRAAASCNAMVDTLHGLLM